MKLLHESFKAWQRHTCNKRMTSALFLLIDTHMYSVHERQHLLKFSILQFHHFCLFSTET